MKNNFQISGIPVGLFTDTGGMTLTQKIWRRRPHVPMQ